MGAQYTDIKDKTARQAIEVIYNARIPSPCRDTTIGQFISLAETSRLGIYFFFADTQANPHKLIYIGRTMAWDLLNKTVQHFKNTTLSGTLPSEGGGDAGERQEIQRANRFLDASISYLLNAPWVVEELLISTLQPELNVQYKAPKRYEALKEYLDDKTVAEYIETRK